VRRIAVLTDRVALATGVRQALAPFDVEVAWHRDQNGILHERVIDAVVACGRDPVDMTALIRRVTATPLLVLGGDESQAATCLDLGADAWLPADVATAVVVAQVRRLLRTRRDPSAPTLVLTVGDVTIDTSERRVRVRGRELELAPREYELLRVMADNRGKALSRDRILAAAWGPRFVGEPKTVDVHVAWLRQKLEGSGLRVTTMRGLGYRLDVLPSQAAEQAVAEVGAVGRSISTGPRMNT
jgi:DNA-binding response OmpR family regulator